jgi:Mrp family chromosome partitioning ATPase
MTMFGTSSRGRHRTEGNAKRDVETNGEGETSPGDQDNGHDASGARLPARSSDGPRVEPSAVMRYDDIPAELGEALRGIVNRYELRTGDQLPKSIAVTSSVPNEGVTTVSQALATMIAQETGSFVCWIDCAWLTPDGGNGHHSTRPNLIDILADQSRILSAFQAAPDLPQLMVLTPGPLPETKRNMIVRSPEFERLLAILAEEFDHVVFDVPPVLAYANGLALLRRSDASLLVVRHRSTTLAQVHRMVEATRPTPNLGIVLNRYRTSIPSSLRRLLGG